MKKGARGGYIYLLYTTQTKYGSPITDVYIKFGNDNFSSIITHEGRKYSLVARGGNPEFAGTCDGDLNYGAKGKYIYLYASWGSFTPSRGLTSITFNGNSSGAVGINGDASKPADLNSGAGGDYIYMHAEYKLREETAEISTEEALRAAVNYNNANILLANDIRLNSPLVVSKATNVTIDLNGHQLDRGMFSEFSSKPEGRAIVVDGKADLTVKDTGEGVQDPSAKETLLTTRFVAADGSEVTQYGVHKLSEIKNHTLYNGWYELDKDLTFTERLRVEGNVHLILADGRTLTDHMGINVPDGQTLTLYGQRLQTGTLNINLTEKSGWAGIGSYLEQSDTGTGDITINGGVINVTGRLRRNGRLIKPKHKKTRLKCIRRVFDRGALVPVQFF